MHPYPYWHWITAAIGAILIFVSPSQWFRARYGRSVSPLLVGVVLIVVSIVPVREISGGGLSLKLFDDVDALKTNSNDTADLVAKMDKRVAYLEASLAYALKENHPEVAKAFVKRQRIVRDQYILSGHRADSSRKRLNGGFDTGIDVSNGWTDIGLGESVVSPETKEKLSDGNSIVIDTPPSSDTNLSPCCAPQKDRRKHDAVVSPNKRP
jgi:hypothetical protein